MEYSLESEFNMSFRCYGARTRPGHVRQIGTWNPSFWLHTQTYEFTDYNIPQPAHRSACFVSQLC